MTAPITSATPTRPAISQYSGCIDLRPAARAHAAADTAAPDPPFTGAVSFRNKANTVASSAHAIAIHIGAASPYASAALPASGTTEVPPTSSPSPMTRPSEVATYRAGIVSEGTVAMNKGNTPLADQPTKISIPSAHSGPSKYSVTSG